MVILFFQAFSSAPTRRAIILGCLLQLFQQVAGINTVMYYSAKIITMAGFTDKSQAIWMSAGVASVNFLCTFIGVFLVERIGRRKLLLTSLMGVCLSLAFLAIGFQLADSNTPKVTIRETGSMDFCSKYGDCSDCTFNTLCGFCYEPVSSGDQLAVNASCLQVWDKNSDYSKIGR